MNQIVDLNKVIEASTTILANMIKKATVDFKVHLAPDLPKVRGDFQELEQVVINLLTNACQALTDKHQPIEIDTAFNSEEKVVTLSVCDKGKGISADILPRIFDPFFTTKRDSGGTGLGLAISYSIVNDHNGTLSVDSRPGHGTTFVLRLPALITVS